MELMDKFAIQRLYLEVESYRVLAESTSPPNKKIILRLCDIIGQLIAHAKSSLLMIDLTSINNFVDADNNAD